MKLELHSTVSFAKYDLLLKDTPSKCSCGESFKTSIGLLIHQNKEWKKLDKELKKLLQSDQSENGGR